MGAAIVRVSGRTVVLAGLLGMVLAATPQAGRPTLSSRFKNVILMIPDGCGIAHFTVARWYKGAPLACDALHVAQVRTYGSNSLITDSAPAATAMASGYKSHDKYIGVLPSSYTLAVPSGLASGFTLPAGWENRPVASVLEAARLKGMATGIIATSTTSHATPAGFTSHWYSRGNEAIIMEQQVYQGVDVVLGGGRRHISAATRTDGESLVDTLVSRGYRIVGTASELAALPDTISRVWGHFSDGAMAPDYDRRGLAEFSHQPSLAEMTAKAIAILSNNAKGSRNGFFLMVEGSQVDWASHANDPVGVMSEYLAFDSAVEVATNFARNSNTMLLVVSDHDNGGMSLGNYRTNANYSSLPMDSVFNPSVFKRATLTGVGVALKMGANPSSSTITSVMNQYYGINDLSQAEIDSIAANANPGNPEQLQAVIGPMISKRAGIGWTTTGHTGNDVPLYYYGPSDHFNTIENTDIARLCAQAMNVSLETANDTLFAEASVLFAGATRLTIDTAGVNSSRGALTVVADGRTGVFPFNKNEAWVNGEKHLMNGLTVYSYRNGKVYLPKQAKDILAGTLRTIPNGMYKLAQQPVLVEVFSLSGRRLRSLTVREGVLNLRTLRLSEGSYLLRLDRRRYERLAVTGDGRFEAHAH